MSIVGFTLIVANNDFADFSVNSQPILMHYSKRYFHGATTLKISLKNIVGLSIKSCQFRGFVKLKKIKKSEKNSGGWVKPQLGFFFLGNNFFCVCVLFFVVVDYMFPKKLDFFNLTRPLNM